jgi:hypothetical protein
MYIWCDTVEEDLAQRHRGSPNPSRQSSLRRPPFLPSPALGLWLAPVAPWPALLPFSFLFLVAARSDSLLAFGHFGELGSVSSELRPGQAGGCCASG